MSFFALKFSNTFMRPCLREIKRTRKLIQNSLSHCRCVHFRASVSIAKIWQRAPQERTESSQHLIRNVGLQTYGGSYQEQVSWLFLSKDRKPAVFLGWTRFLQEQVAALRWGLTAADLYPKTPLILLSLKPVFDVEGTDTFSEAIIMALQDSSFPHQQIDFIPCLVEIPSLCTFTLRIFGDSISSLRGV